jgi:hypothetical protein
MTFDASDLRDPQPPVPGDAERAKVAARAHELGRRRRLLQGGGALALVAAVAVSVAALTAGGTSDPGGTNRVEAASPSDDTSATTSASDPVVSTTTTVAPAPETTAAPGGPTPTTSAPSAPSVGSSDAAPSTPVVPVAPVAPATVTLSGTVTGNPADTTVTLTLYGPAGAIDVGADAAGHFSISGLAPGDYEIDGAWYNTAGTAGRAQKLGSFTLTGDATVNLVMQP